MNMNMKKEFNSNVSERQDLEANLTYAEQIINLRTNGGTNIEERVNELKKRALNQKCAKYF